MVPVTAAAVSFGNPDDGGYSRVGADCLGGPCRGQITFLRHWVVPGYQVGSECQAGAASITACTCEIIRRARVYNRYYGGPQQIEPDIVGKNR